MKKVIHLRSLAVQNKTLEVRTMNTSQKKKLTWKQENFLFRSFGRIDHV